MFHFSEAITDTKGNALIGFYVKAINIASGEVVPIYSDDAGTAIENVSGIENAAKVNSDGNAQFYIGDGEYHLDIYASDGTTFIRRIEDLPMAKIGVLRAETKADLAELDTAYPAVLVEAGSVGLFVFDSSDLSIQVSADPEQTVYIAPSSDDTGASGAWVRAGTAPQTDSPESGVLSGCAVVYIDDLDFTMSAGTYVLDGVTHTAAQQDISLDAADGDDPRIDILYLDAEGVLQKLTGTPAASPSKPSVDPSAGLELTFVLVPAGATTLTAVVTEDIYLENAEWTVTESDGTDFDLEATTDPYAGTKHIATIGVFSANAYLDFNRASNLVFGGDGNLILRIKPTNTSWTKRNLLCQWVSDGAALGLPAVVRHGSYGLDVTNTSAYQVVIVPKSVFGIPANLEVDQLRITCTGSGNATPSFRMDNIQLQTNGTAIGNSDLTQSIADARYVNVTGDTMTGALVVPEEAYDATGWNGDLSVPTKNAVRDKFESLAPGGVITGMLAAANNLSDVANAATARTNLGLGTAAVLSTTDVDERARDAVGTALTAGTGITVTPNDGSDTITVATTITQYTDEMAQDAIGTILTDTGLAVVTYSDATPSIDVNVPAAVDSDFRTGTDATKALTADGVWDAAATVALTPGTNVSLSMASGINFTLAMGGNYTLDNPTNVKPGQTGFIQITQDGTGSRTLAYGTNWKFAGGTDPVLSTAASSVDVLFYMALSSTSIFANLIKAVA
jgi:hypothetical protein